MDIKSLPKDVRAHLRSGANINSISQCVTELVLNCIDAKSTAIAVRINLLTFRIQVVDNGKGVTKSNMNLIGLRYMTSKCQSLSDLKKIKRFGFRGEALSSIRSMSKKTAIVSRPDSVENTYSKTYDNGKWNAVEVVKQRPSQGTTVTIEGFMHNLPVRQKRIHQNLDIHGIKRDLENLAIIHPNISFNLRDDATGKIVFQSNKTKTVSQALANLYPEISIEDLLEIKITKNKISVSGLISKNHSTNAQLQFIYLNKRPIISPKIQKLVNSLLLKSLIYRKPASNDCPQRFLNHSSTTEKTGHPIYALNIRCPYSEVDLTISPSKKTVEFKHWNVVLNCVRKAVEKLLERENLITTNLTKEEVNLPEAASFKSQFGISQLKGAVKSVPMKRKNTENVNELPKKKRTNSVLSGGNIEIVSGNNISANNEKGHKNLDDQPKTGSSTRSNFNDIQEHANILTLAEVHNEEETGKSNKLRDFSSNKDKLYNKKTSNENLISSSDDVNVTPSNGRPNEFQNKHSKNNSKEDNSMHTHNRECFKIVPTITKHHKNKNIKGRPTLLGWTKTNPQRNSQANFNQDDGSNIRKRSKNVDKTNNRKRSDSKSTRNKANRSIQNLKANEDINIENKTAQPQITQKSIYFPKPSYGPELRGPTKANQKIFPISTISKIPINVFEKHKNTQSLVLNSEINTTRANHNSLLNSTINTNILEDQIKGKELIMDMFLKSTLVFPYEEPQVKDNAMETRIVETTKENLITECRKQNTTMMTVSWKIMSKKTIVTNSVHPACNLEETVLGNEQKLSIPNDANQKRAIKLNNNYEEIQGFQNTRSKKNHCKSAKNEMISKCIQTTMMEHQKEFKIEFNCVSQSGPDTNSKFIFSNSFPRSSKYNITFSKYFEKSFKSKPEQYCFPVNRFELNNNRQGFYNLGEPKKYDIGESNYGFNLKENFLNKLRTPRKKTYHIDNYRPINKIRVPKFGTTECLHKPFHNYGISGNHFHEFPTSNMNCNTYPVANNCTIFNNHEISNYNVCNKNFRMPIRNYFSDYNFDFSNLNTCGQPFREFMKKNCIFERPYQSFRFASRTNPLSNNFRNHQTTNCAKNYYADELCDTTVPLYQSYNPIKLNRWGPHFNFAREEPLSNLNNYCTTKWNVSRQYHTKNKYEGCFHEKVLDQNFIDDLCNKTDGKPEINIGFGKRKEGRALEDELYQSIFRDYGQQSCFQRNRRMNDQNKMIISKQPHLKNHNFVPVLARNIGVSNYKRGIPNGKHHHKLWKQSNCDMGGEVPSQKCYSPFFQKPARKNKHNTKIARGTRQNSNHIMKDQKHFKPNRNVFAEEHLNVTRTWTRFSHKNQKYAPIKEASTYSKKNVPLHQPKSSPTKEHFFAAAEDHQGQSLLLPSTKIFSAPWPQFLNHKNVFLEESQMQPLFLPKQPHYSPKKKNDFFFLEQKENHAEKSNIKWNQQKLEKQGSVNVFNMQPSNQIMFDQHQNQEEKETNWQYNSMFIINPEKDTQNDFLFPPADPQNNCPIIQPTKSKNVNQKINLSLKKFNTEPLQSKATHFMEAFSNEDPCIPHTNFNFQQKSRPTINELVTSHKNSEQSSERYKIDLFSEPKPFFSNLATPKCNNVIEYSFLTPNINKSSTIDDTIKKISLCDSKNFDISNPQEVAPSNLTVCSRNFKPALSSTRFDAVEETWRSKPSRTNLEIEKVGTVLENCSFSSGVIEGTPSKILSNFFVPSLSQIIASKSQPHRATDDNSKKSCSALNITIDEIKKSILIGKGMDEDSKLNKQSVSAEIDQSNINLADSADCNREHFVNYTMNSGAVAHQTDINNVSEEKNDDWIKNVDVFGGVFYIHKRTGMTSMFRPKQDTHFNLIKRIEFVPKGFSPIFIESKKIDASLSPTSKKSLHAAILENYESELNTIKWSNYIYSYNDAKAFFEDLYREKTKQFHCHIPNAGLNELPKSMVKLYNEVQAHSFTKDIFTELEVIGQLDKKFIITLLTGRKLIILFDQHAVHERARLEQLLNDYKEAATDIETIKYKSTKSHEKIIIPLTSTEINILTNFKNLFENLGLRYTTVGNNVEITHIPLCVYNKSIRSKEKSKDICLDNINTLIYEHIAMVISTRGVSSKIPNILQNIINSEACRGAIKFGDTLTISECEKCIKQLSVCQLPFQCAHGRPTLIPVVSLKHNFEVKQMKPNLIKLHSK